MFGVTHLMCCDLIDIFRGMLEDKGLGCLRVSKLENFLLTHSYSTHPQCPPKRDSALGPFGDFMAEALCGNLSCMAQELSKLFHSHRLGEGRCVLA